jgi:succinyl-diaminopimelate desuccinylase
MAHGAMPHQGCNPIPVVAKLTTALGSIEAELQEHHGTHPHLGEVYITPTHLDAGSIPQMNVIPSRAVACFDIRTVPGVDHQDLLARIRATSEQIAAPAGVDVDIEVLVDRPATETAMDEPVVRAVAAAHTAVTGEGPRYGGVPGTTDGTILWRDAGLPVVVYGPGGKWIAHQKDEYVEIDDLLTHAEVYIEAACRFLGA